MRIKQPKLILVTVAAALLLTFGATRDHTQAQQTNADAGGQRPSDGIERINVADLRLSLRRGEAVAVDVRGADSYAKAHIKGAKHIPVGEIEQRAGELARDKMIVTYCS